MAPKKNSNNQKSTLLEFVLETMNDDTCNIVITSNKSHNICTCFECGHIHHSIFVYHD